MSERPYAVRSYRDKASAWQAQQKGRDVVAGYYLRPGRYATAEAAQKQADYTNQFTPVRPAYVVDTRTGERVESPSVTVREIGPMKDRQPIGREDRARLALEWCKKIAGGHSTVYLPTYQYLGNEFGWSEDVAGTAVRDLTISGALERTAPGVYEILDWNGQWRRSP
jgi:hypothetical protein